MLGTQSLADVANWADSLRSETTYKQTMWYHFEKIDDDVQYIPHLHQLPEWQLKKGGVVMAILVAVDNLKSSKISIQEKTDSLKFLIHFVGDVHQPLHTGPPEDNGGVKHDLVWFGQPMSLHKVWDSGMIYSGHLGLFAKTKSFEEEAKAYASYLIKENSNKATDLDFDAEAWLMESMGFRKAAYDPTSETDQNLYQSRNLPVVDRRLYESGVRLGALLNSIYDNTPLTRAQDLWNRILKVTDPKEFMSLRP